MCIQTCIFTPKLLDSIQIQHLLTKNGFPKGLPRNSELRIEKMRLYIVVMRPWFSVWTYPSQFSYWYFNSWLLVSRGRISQELVKTCVPNPQQGLVSFRKTPKGLSCILCLMREMFSKVQKMSLSENKYFSMIALVSQSLELQETKLTKLCYQSHSSWCDMARQCSGFSILFSCWAHFSFK